MKLKAQSQTKNCERDCHCAQHPIAAYPSGGTRVATHFIPVVVDEQTQVYRFTNSHKRKIMTLAVVLMCLLLRLASKMDFSASSSQETLKYQTVLYVVLPLLAAFVTNPCFVIKTMHQGLVAVGPTLAEMSYMLLGGDC